MKKILFGVAALGLLGLAGAGIGLKAQDTVEAKAAGDTFTVKARLYSDAPEAPEIRIHLWQNGAKPYTNWESLPAMTSSKQDGYYLYTYEAPNTYIVDAATKSINRVIFRAGGKQSDDTWLGGYLRNCTDDFGFTISIGDSKVEVSEGYYKTTNYFDTSMARVWINRNGHYGDGFSYNLKANGKYYPARGYQQMFEDGTHWPYYDIPRSELDGKALTFGIFETNQSVWYGSSEYVVTETSVTYSEGNNIHYINAYYDGGKMKFNFADSVSSVLATAFPKILEGYFSCESNGDNGYGAFSSFASVWGTNNVNGDLSLTNITDFAENHESGHGYGDLSNKNTTYTCAAKIAEMQANYDALPTARSVDSDYATDVGTTTTIVVISSIAMAIAAAGFFIARKRRAE